MGMYGIIDKIFLQIRKHILLTSTETINLLLDWTISAFEENMIMKMEIFNFGNICNLKYTYTCTHDAYYLEKFFLLNVYISIGYRKCTFCRAKTQVTLKPSYSET